MLTRALADSFAKRFGFGYNWGRPRFCLNTNGQLPHLPLFITHEKSNVSPHPLPQHGSEWLRLCNISNSYLLPGTARAPTRTPSGGGKAAQRWCRRRPCGRASGGRTSTRPSGWVDTSRRTLTAGSQTGPPTGAKSTDFRCSPILLKSEKFWRATPTLKSAAFLLR